MVKSLFRFVVILLVCLLWTLHPVPFHVSNMDNPSKSKLIDVISENRGGYFDPINFYPPPTNKTQKKISISILEKYFPDWEDREKFEATQLQFFQSGRRKLRDADKLRIHESIKWKILEAREQDAMDYFSGTGLYEHYQNIDTPPNIFDTRKTFLEKMLDPKMRRNFLNYYNSNKK